jgi:paraquat-inducible protein B
VGAPVVFRGVAIGSVVKVSAYMDPAREVFATPVYVELVHSSIQVPSDLPADVDRIELVRSWIEDKGLRARLDIESLVTGKLYVQLGFFPDSPLNLLGLDDDVPEMPAIPTQMEVLGQSVRDLLDRLRDLPIESTFANLNSSLAAAREFLQAAELKSVITRSDSLLEESRTLVRKASDVLDSLRGTLNGVDQNAQDTLVQARRTLEILEGTVADVRKLVAPGSPLQYEIITALEEMTRMVRSLRALSDSVARDPNQLIFGRQRSGADR